ncbi:hypothetical protein FACUT_10913 [Fusarium acutatum]|uniref:Uncharacterized protein n=1 Tax=Fusarium acutatum TaxID=78861 RepID=A0A8H4JFD0_9HYPO|nr:hypothetical protein FACUT_10913 [Fusarium acutatum]
MSLSLDQKTRLFARQVQRFHEYSAGTGRPNSKIIKAPDVKLAAALEPAFGMYESGDTKATHESWPFYWQLHGKGCLLTRDLEWFRHMGYELLYSGKVGASDLPRSTYEEPPKQNWDELYGPPAPQQTELERAAMWAETGSHDPLARLDHLVIDCICVPDPAFGNRSKKLRNRRPSVLDAAQASRVPKDQHNE